MKKCFMLILIGVCLSACLFTPQTNSDILGFWTNPQYSDSLITYERVNSMPENDYGFAFKNDAIFEEHKNSGFCGTPPISYEDYQGSWSMRDSVIYISVPYWGGTSHYTWKLISADSQYLSLILIGN